MKKIFLVFVLACVTLLSLRAGAKSTAEDPINKPVIVYVTDSINNMVEFTEGEFECSYRRRTFMLTVEDSLFSYDSLGCNSKGVASLYVTVQINDKRELRESFAMKVNCYTENGKQVYFTSPTSKSNMVVEWLLFDEGYVQFDIPGSREGQWLTVLVPCDEHFLGY